tara:strand:+ start:346 stop:579 length:234 start_codon:yes stop_codon:yes gene_type:complete
MNRIHELKRQRAKEVERIIWEKLMDNHPELFSKLQEDALETWELYNEEEAVEIYEDDAEFNRVCEMSAMDRLNGPLG